MLGKSLRAGRGFAGVINYLYDGELEGRKTEDKQAKVVCHSEGLLVPYSAEDTKGREAMISDFVEQAKNYSGYVGDKTGFIGEHVLSFTKSDEKKLTPDLLKNITEEYVKMAGIDKTQYVGISHKDTDNFHVHLLFNRAMDNGKKYSEWREKNKTIERATALSMKYGLELRGNQKAIAEGKEVVKLRSQMEDIKQLRASHTLLGQARNLLHLEKLSTEKKVAFAQDSKGVLFDENTYLERDLKAVFAGNREEASKQYLKEQERLEAMGKSVSSTEYTGLFSGVFQEQKEQEVEREKGGEQGFMEKPVQPIDIRDEDGIARMPKKKMGFGHIIKIRNVERKKVEKELQKGLSR